ncbi:hypothetical protein BO94DRAFT_116021 [Aspergillus sclerotioniger CBS 115572]|uniref:Uncharacterized protein n=1 Tax=Aspergillus sclerotioniger CBS 115572 TaxID=1450535 RepID=A0A317WFR3_9EURO|nr:hypothetical protein BO94DRAFT_116021 [Aspergillus sclerotioniger CBS 115572]PWY83858.1 hypothetical protein BO94DRAFT_116021 [Aspergillus sclerotioniger CBS 115572]
MFTCCVGVLMVSKASQNAISLLLASTLSLPGFIGHCWCRVEYGVAREPIRTLIGWPDQRHSCRSSARNVFSELEKPPYVS